MRIFGRNPRSGENFSDLWTPLDWHRGSKMRFLSIFRKKHKAGPLFSKKSVEKSEKIFLEIIEEHFFSRATNPTIAPPQNHSKVGVDYAPRLSREKIFPIFRPIFLRTRVPPCVFSKNRQKLSKIAYLKPLAKTLGPTNLKISRGSVLFVQGYTKVRGAMVRFPAPLKSCSKRLPP